MQKKQSRNSKCWCNSGYKYKYCCFPERENIVVIDVINRYIPDAHNVGKQPVRVLSNNILQWFVKTYPQFKNDLNISIDQKEFKKGVKYLDDEAPIRVIAEINPDKRVAVEETFLSYLWIICYSMIVIYDEQIMKPRLRKKTDYKILKKAYELLKYGFSLINKYSDWKKDDLPNPERYKVEDKLYVEKANSVFLHAVNFIMCHEYGHFSLGHVDRDRMTYGNGVVRTDKQNLLDEIEADEFAFRMVMKGVKSKNDLFNKHVGIVSAMCALLFFSSTLQSTNYPDPDLRLKTVMEALEINEKSNIWGLACLGLRMWVLRNNAKIDVPIFVDSYKEYFYDLLNDLNINVKVQQ